MHIWKDDFSEFKDYLETVEHRKISRKKGETIKAIGEDFSRHFYVLSGTACTYALHETGHASMGWLCYGRGALFPLFYPEHLITAQVSSFIAMEDTQLMVFERDRIDQCMTQNPAFNRAMYNALSELFDQTLTVLSESRYRSGMENLCRFLYTTAFSPDWSYGKLHISQTELGSIVGINRANTASCLKILREAGIVETGINKIIVKNPEKLKEWFSI